MTENSCTASDYLAALTAFEQAAEHLASVDPVMLGSQEVLESLQRLETAVRKAPYAQHVLTNIACEQGLPGQLGYTGIKELLTDKLRLAGPEARDRVHGARARAPRVGRGVSLAPVFPLITDAQRAGRISERHATVMEKILDKARHLLPQPKLDMLEGMLATAAADVRPEDLVKIGRSAMAHIDPDGTEPKDDAIARDRGLEVGKQNDDLMSQFGGDLTPEGRALLDTVLAKLARPGVNNPDDADEPVDLTDQDAVAAAAKRDHRTAAQRNHDALIAALRIAVGSGQLGQHRGLACIPIITLGIDQLESESGFATTATGGRMPVADALRMMGANPKYVLVLDLASRPLFLGREKRLATADQRIALYGSEQGCTAPGCDAPATMTQVHHITEWADGGRTDITALTLACDKHHGNVVPGKDSRRGFETITLEDGPYAGRTGWRRTADPTGEFKVNHAHHDDELYRQAQELWRKRREQFETTWRVHDLRRQYQDVIGDLDTETSAYLDGPHGPPALERMLTEHDIETDWCRAEPTNLGPAA